jgi:hypothetical protein
VSDHWPLQVKLHDLKGTDVIKILYYTDTPEAPGGGRFELSIKSQMGRLIRSVNAYDDMGATPSRMQCTDIINEERVTVFADLKGNEYRLFELIIEK